MDIHSSPGLEEQSPSQSARDKNFRCVAASVTPWASGRVCACGGRAPQEDG